jgi:hypothetical protein
MKNKKLKTAMFEMGVTHAQVAKLLDINARTFTNKINRLNVNGYEAKFTATEKVVLALKFDLNENEIE